MPQLQDLDELHLPLLMKSIIVLSFEYCLTTSVCIQIHISFQLMTAKSFCKFLLSGPQDLVRPENHPVLGLHKLVTQIFLTLSDVLQLLVKDLYVSDVLFSALLWI